MFTRSSSAEPNRLEPRPSKPVSSGSQHRPTGPESDTKSVIGNDLKIIGQGLKIISQGILQIDGDIASDVQAAEIIVGEQGKVTGMVAAQQVVVHGKVSGVICAKTISLQSSSQVEGDIHHMSFAIEKGALFEGRSRRARTESDLNAVIEAKSAAQPKYS
jgi:cytoskeletal protein CcmA (bactofilin family)